jgi:hypothetical protein
LVQGSPAARVKQLRSSLKQNGLEAAVLANVVTMRMSLGLILIGVGLQAWAAWPC